jgi:hypothetical protein
LASGTASNINTKAMTGKAVRQASSASSSGWFDASSVAVDFISCLSLRAFTSGSRIGMPCSLNSTTRQLRVPGTPS